MAAMKLRLHQYELPLRHTFTIAHGTTTTQPTLIVELEQDGLRGYGEATASRYYGVSCDGMRGRLESVRAILETQRLVDPAELWQQLQPHLAADPFAQCALDEAAHDLWGKIHGRRVYEMWGLAAEQLPTSNYTIGIDTIETMVSKLQEFPGWPIYKIKLGTKHDLEIVRQLRQHTQAIFRVDANCGWTRDETLRNAEHLRDLGVEFIEQPLPPDRWSDMAMLRTESALPMIADESCQVESDVDRCAEAFHGVNIKLVKCGGLTPARRMIDQARRRGLQVMVGCMTESTVGISAIAQLLPLLDYVDMDGALLLAQDIAQGVTIDKGHCHYGRRPGCGVELIPA